MHPLEKETLKILQQEQLVKAGDSVIVAVSAGPDSMALLHVLARLATDLNITLTAVYVNHGLRPDETLQEEELVKEITAGLGVAAWAVERHETCPQIHRNGAGTAGKRHIDRQRPGADLGEQPLVHERTRAIQARIGK